MPVTLKPDGARCEIQEQIIEDVATKMTLQFEVAPDGETVLRIFSDIMFGNRQFNFKDGLLVGTGTSTRGVCRPAWMTKIEEQLTSTQAAPPAT